MINLPKPSQLRVKGTVDEKINYIIAYITTLVNAIERVLGGVKQAETPSTSNEASKNEQAMKTVDHTNALVQGDSIDNVYQTHLWVKNGVAYINWSSQIKGDLGDNASLHIATITDEKLRPMGDVAVMGFGSDKSTFTVTLNPQGDIGLYSFGGMNIPGGTFIRFQMVFPIK